MRGVEFMISKYGSCPQPECELWNGHAQPHTHTEPEATMSNTMEGKSEFLKVQIVEDAGGVRAWLVNEAWALDKFPELAEHLDRLTVREGTPEKKLGMRTTHLPPNRDSRGGVMIVMYPPAALRDATLDQIKQVLGSQAHSLISTLAREIHQSYTSDPVDETALRNMQTILNTQLGT